MTLIADVFLILGMRKSVVRYMSEMSLFRGPFFSQDVKEAQTLVQSERQ